MRQLRPICMPEWTEKPYDFDTGYLTGWGWDGTQTSSTLKVVKSKIWPQYFCRHVLENVHFEENDSKNYQQITA